MDNSVNHLTPSLSSKERGVLYPNKSTRSCNLFALLSNSGFIPVLTLLLVYSSGLNAQYSDHRNRNIDSLEHVLATDPPTGVDLSRIYRTLTWGYLEIDAEKSMFNARKCIEIALSIEQWRHAADGYWLLGVNFHTVLQYDSAMVCFEKALESTELMRKYPERWEEEIIDDEVAAIYGTIGNLYNTLGKYHEAIEYYLKALKLFEKYPSLEQSQASAYNNMGVIYLTMGNYEQAEINFKKADYFAHVAEDSLKIAGVKLQFANLYIETKAYDKALQNAEIAYEYFFSRPEEGRRKVEIFNVFSEIYLNGFNDDQKAEDYARQALTLLEDYSFPMEKSVALRLLSAIHMKRHEWRKAEQAATEALVADDKEPSNTLILYQILAKTYAYLGNAAKTDEYIDKQQALQSSWSTKQYQSSLRELEVKYETEKKELLIGQQQQVIRSQKGTSKNPTRHAELVSASPRSQGIAEQVRNDDCVESVVFRSPQ